jgi:Ubiquitin family
VRKRKASALLPPQELTVSDATRVRELKGRLAGLYGLATEQQVLTAASGIVLRDEDRLQSYALQAGATLWLSTAPEPAAGGQGAVHAQEAAQ